MDRQLFRPAAMLRLISSTSAAGGTSLPDIRVASRLLADRKTFPAFEGCASRRVQSTYWSYWKAVCSAGNQPLVADTREHVLELGGRERFLQDFDTLRSVMDRF